MKNILLLILAFFAVNSYGQGDLSTKVKGQTQSVSGFNVGELQVAYEQATKTGAVKALIETGNDNLLSNPEFEHQSYLQGWTYVQSAGTFSAAPNTTSPLGGSKMVTITASSGTGYIEQCNANGLPGVSGQDGTSEIWVQADATSSLEVCALRDNVAVNCTDVVAGATNRYIISAPLTSVCNGVTVKTKATMTGTFSVDKAKTYLGTPSGKVAQAQWFGGVLASGATNCAYATSSSTFTNYALDNDCNAFTASGRVEAPSTKIPAVVIPAGSPSGNYFVQYKGRAISVNGTCRFRLSDGSTAGVQAIVYTLDAGLLLTQSNPDISWRYSYTTSASDTVIQVQAVADGGAGSCQIAESEPQFSYGFDVYYYPPSQEIYSSDSLGWFIDANIGGANPNLGTASVATYTEITDAGLDLVVNSAKGSAPAKILCSGTNAPGTTTCSAGSESVGLAFTIPKEGQYEVCADFSHRGATALAGSVFSHFQLIETPLSAQTNLQIGEVKASSGLSSDTSGVSTGWAHPVNNCGIFTFLSTGEKAVRLMYEQTVAGGSPPLNSLLADRSATSGQRDIHFTVRPAINLEKINGSFKQITDALETIPNRNYVINGNFDFWQRGTSLASGTGVRYLADRWVSNSVGSTNTPSRQSFTVGQTDVPGNPEFFHRFQVTTSAGASNFAILTQRSEDVTLLAGKTVTLSFYAKAAVPLNIATSLTQQFGTGGSPSVAVGGIGPGRHSLTTTWQKFTKTISVPSVAGKTLGTNNNDYLDILFWVDCGSSFAASCDSIGQQSGTVDIAQVKLEEGAVATPFVLAGGDLAGERQSCERFYQTGYVIDSAYQAAGSDRAITLPFKVTMRVTPAVTATASGTNTNHGAISVIALNGASGPYGWLVFSPTTALGFVRNEATLTADAEL